MTNTTAWFALIVFLLQSTPAATPIRFGNFASQLTSEDLKGLEQLGAAGGAKGSPWLLEPFGQGGGTIRVYLPPVTQTAQLRRGQALEVTQRARDKVWVVLQTVQYAQIVEMGRDYNSISGQMDIHRPFPVSGKFSDDELISLVTFIRTSPDQVKGDWRISFLSGDPSSVMLRLIGPMRGQDVSVVRQGSTWKVTETRLGIS